MGLVISSLARFLEKEGKGRTVTSYLMAGDNLVTKVEPFKDDFNDGNYTGWTVYSGTWDALNHYLTSGTSASRIYKTHSTSSGDADFWFSYYDGDTSSTSYYAMFYLRLVRS